MTIEQLEEHKSFGGMQRVYAHQSQATNSTMRFAIFLPPQALAHKKTAVLYWLSGLTCSEQNFIIKAGAQRVAAQLGITVVVPDTSPRNVMMTGITQQENLGEGAGFYVDATQVPWSLHYRMYEYVNEELPELIAQHFPVDIQSCGIFGHSMGGHGALTVAMKNPARFRSLSALAPICSPEHSPSASYAFEHYLGKDRKRWQEYDACALVKKVGWPHGSILVDQGMSDNFIANLNPQLLKQACDKAGVVLDLRMQEGYGHNYYFVASFIEDHLRFHATALKN